MSKDWMRVLKNIGSLIEENGRVSLDRESFDYLFKQAERVPALEKFKTHTESLATVVADLEQQNKRYREVLEKISDHETYGIDIVTREPLRSGAGELAIEALEGDPNES